MKSRYLAPQALLLVMAASVVLAASVSAEAETGSPVGSAATLSVVYELTNAGEDIPKSHEHHHKWSMNDRYEIKALIKAQTLSPLGSTNAPKQPASSGKEGDFMARMMAARQKCGDDSDCMQQEIMGTKAGHFQMFISGTQSGTYKIDESMFRADFDAACSLAHEARCAYNTTITGSGALSSGGKNEFPATASAEIDFDAGVLILKLPIPGVVKLTKTVTSVAKGVKTGSSAMERTEHLGKIYDQPIKASCGVCKTASGTQTRKLPDNLFGHEALLTIHWAFSRP